LKYRLVDLLACPMCKHFPLELYVLEREEVTSRKLPGEPPLCELYCALLGKRVKELAETPPCEACIRIEISTGVLYCSSCRRWYPVIDTIPHMLPDDLREKERESELAFLERYKQSLPEKIVYEGRPHSISK